MKQISLLFFILYISNLSAQKFKKTIELDEKLKLWNYTINNNGEFLFHESQFTMAGNPKNGILKFFDSNANEIKAIVIDKKRINLENTNHFKYLLGRGFLTDWNSIKPFNSKDPEYNLYPSYSYENYIFSPFSIKLKENEPLIKRLNPIDLSIEKISFQIPSIKNYSDKTTFQFKYETEPISFLIKEFKNQKQDMYHILKYDENLKFESQIDLNVNLEDKYLKPSNNGAGSFNSYEASNGNTIALRPNAGTMGNVLTLSDGYYCYGMYGNTIDTDKKFFNKSSFKDYIGFYIFKFDNSGVLLWKNFYPLISKDLNKGKIWAVTNSIGLIHNTINNTLLLSILNQQHNRFEITEVNMKNGELIKNSSHNIKLYMPNPPIKGYYGLNSDIYLNDIFGTKIKFSYQAMLAAFSNEEFYNYIKLKSNGKSIIAYDAKFTLNELIVFEELDKKEGKYNILKF